MSVAPVAVDIPNGGSHPAEVVANVVSGEHVQRLGVVLYERRCSDRHRTDHGERSCHYGRG